MLPELGALRNRFGCLEDGVYGSHVVDAGAACFGTWVQHGGLLPRT